MPLTCDILTPLVLEYQKSHDQKIFKKIHKPTKKLVYGVIAYYGLLKWPSVVLEDLEEDCRSFVLVKCINTYDNTRGATFVTHYTWWCMSHIQAKRNYYMHRLHTLVTPSYFNETLHRINSMEDNEGNCEDSMVFSTFRSINNLHHFKKVLNEFLGVKKGDF
jgi:hypothetical protein